MKPQPSFTWPTRLVPAELVVLVVLSLSVGALAAGSTYLAAAAVAAGAAIVVLGSTSTGRLAGSLLILLAAPIVGSHADLTEQASVALRWADDAVMLVGWVLLLLKRRHLSGDGSGGAWALALLAASALAGVAMTHGSFSLTAGAIWQSFRWIGLLGWGFYVAERLPFKKRVRVAFWMLMVWSLGNVVVGIVQLLTSVPAEYRLSLPIPPGMFGQAAAGAIVGTALIVLVLIDRTSPMGFLTRRHRIVGIVTGLGTLVISARFQPLIGMVAVLLLIWIRRTSRGARISPALLFAALPFVLMTTIVVTSEALTESGPRNQLLADVASRTPTRVSLFEGALELAEERAPLGWGLGTYGSGLDRATETETFTHVGLGSAYGFSDESYRFRTDSHLANLLGERGYLGVLLWMLGMAAVMAFALRLAGVYPFAVATLVVAVVISPVGPAFKSAPYTLLLLAPAFLTFRLPSDPAP